MRSGHFENHVEERITVLTEWERIEGRMFHMGGNRLSDFLNSPIQAESAFLKIKEPTIFCRRTGKELIQVPFLMVARDRIVMVMMYSPNNAENAAAGGLLDDPLDDPLARPSSSRFF